MSYYGSWKIDDTLTFACNTHDPDTGVATDADSAPTYRVYEDETTTPILTGSMALLDAGNTVGFYSEQITLSAGNDFEKGKSYTIYITATVDSDAGTMSHNFQMEAEVDANTVSPTVSADMVQISGDSAAADNLETAADGGSYNLGGGGVVAASVAAQVAADVTAISGDAAAANNAESFFDGTGYAGTNNVIPTTTAVTDRVTANVDQLGGVAQSLTDLKDFADAGYDPATDKVQGVVLVDTTTTNSDMVSEPLNEAETESEVNDALVALNLDHLAKTVTGSADMTSEVADNTVLSRILANGDTSAFTPSTDGLQPIRDRGDAAWPTATAVTVSDKTGFSLSTAGIKAIWDQATSALTTGASIGKLLVDNINATISSRSSHAASAIWSVAVRVLTANTNFNDPTAAANRTEMDNNSTQLAAIVADTNELQADDVPGLIAALNDPTAAAIVNEWESQSQSDPTGFHVNLKEVGDTPQTAGDIAGLINALNDLSAAQVNTEVDTAFTTQMADSVSSDGSIATREQAIYAILQILTEFAIAGTTMTVKKVDGSTQLMTFTLDDDTDPTSLTRAS